MADIRDFKCPSCGGAIHWDSTAQKMKCPFCETEFDISTLQSFDDDLRQDEKTDDMNWQSGPEAEWTEGETDNMRVYVCKSCGGEIIGDKDMGASSCPYCGNSVIVPSQFKGDLKPDILIPFKLNKEQAKDGLRRHMKGKRLLPKVFKDENHIDEIKGIYVPFWLFDAQAEADARYKAEQVNSWTDSKFRYTETRVYSVSRSGTLGFENVACDGSSKLDDRLMDSIGPFNSAEAVPFQTAYLSGYLADRYDVTADQCRERANERIRKSTADTFGRTVTGYSSVRTESCSIRLSNARTKYALYPVWLLNTTWRENRYMFAMNGQTGRFIGDLPEDKGAYARWFALIGGIAAVAALGIQYLIYLM